MVNLSLVGGKIYIFPAHFPFASLFPLCCCEVCGSQFVTVTVKSGSIFIILSFQPEKASQAFAKNYIDYTTRSKLLSHCICLFAICNRKALLAEVLNKVGNLLQKLDEQWVLLRESQRQRSPFIRLFQDNLLSALKNGFAGCTVLETLRV